MENFMEKFKKYWGWVTFVVSVLTILIGGFTAVLRGLDNQNEEMAKAIQMSEKAIIWNKEIPKIERASVCDDYLARGYNSYTKKLCENVILADDSIKIEKESVKNEESMDRFKEFYNSNYDVTFCLLYN